MINRELIRLKVVQLVYAYSLNAKNTQIAAENELELSLSKAYQLYIYLLNSLVNLRRAAEYRIDTQKAKVARLGKGEVDKALEAIANNAILRLLQEDEVLTEYVDQLDKETDDEPTFISTQLQLFLQFPGMIDYLAIKKPSFSDDKSLVRKFYRAFYMYNDDLEARLEDQNIYWTGDKEIVDSFVMKTLNRFDEHKSEGQMLQQPYNSDDDHRFAKDLFNAALTRAEEIRKLIDEGSKNWGLKRMALMDVIISQTALAEILSFPEIPLSVSLNEYINIAKMYSTPDSASYINGLLDHIIRTMRSEHNLLK